jgi:hypothetical protein
VNPVRTAGIVATRAKVFELGSKISAWVPVAEASTREGLSPETTARPWVSTAPVWTNPIRLGPTSPKAPGSRTMGFQGLRAGAPTRPERVSRPSGTKASDAKRDSAATPVARVSDYDWDPRSRAVRVSRNRRQGSSAA